MLIVDDRRLNRKLLRVTLQAEGMEILEAENGQEALDLLKRGKVDCVVTDVLMPEMDGYRLCQEIRANPRLRALPIIVHTATYVSPGDKKLALEIGADMYLKKPSPADAMCEAIRDLAKRKRKKKPKARPEVVLKQYSAALIKKLEEKNLLLQEEQEKFRQITETIQEAFWITSPDLRHVYYVSPVYEMIWGRTCDSLYRSPSDWLETIHPEDQARVLKNALERSATQVYEIEYRIVRPDGSLRWIKVRSFPIRDQSGAVSRVTGTATDVTEQKDLLEQFQQAQKMELVGRLAGGVAHDFNNHLTAIVGISELSMQDLPQDHPARADLEEIRVTGHRAAQVTQQLLAFSRRQVFEPRTIDLNEVVRNSEKMLRRLIGEDIQLAPRLAAYLPPVSVDPAQLEQVLVNFCVNSRDAMPKGGKITIETSAAALTEELRAERCTVPPGKYAVLSASDTGEGMSDEVQSHLFEPFFTTKPVGKGTGLGLATCYGIVKQSGGYIFAESAPKEGSTFKIYLPVAKEGVPARPKPSEQRPPPARGRETILVVEDEAVVRRLICRVLRAAGYSILEGGSGQDGLKLTKADKQKTIRLAFVDVIMPRMNGRELFAELRSLRPDMRILFSSGYPDETLFQEGVLEDGIPFLRKPFTPDSLRRKVREVLDSSQQTGESR